MLTVIFDYSKNSPSMLFAVKNLEISSFCLSRRIKPLAKFSSCFSNPYSLFFIPLENHFKSFRRIGQSASYDHNVIYHLPISVRDPVGSSVCWSVRIRPRIAIFNSGIGYRILSRHADRISDTGYQNRILSNK